MCSVLTLRDRKRKLPSSNINEKSVIKVEPSALVEGARSLSCQDENDYSNNSNVLQKSIKKKLKAPSLDIQNGPVSLQTPKKKSKKQFTCQVHGCGKSFPQKYNLDRHYKSFHEIEQGKCHLCDLCLTEFPTKHDLILHQEAKHPVSSIRPSTSSHVCQEPGCDKKYTRRDHLLRHMRTRHPSSYSILKQQQQQEEEEEKEENEEENEEKKKEKTGKQVGDKVNVPNLQVHKFECTLCGATFHYKHGLVRHHTRTHTNSNRPYECTTCLQRFKKKSDLQAHSYVHTGILPFACEFCQANEAKDVRFLKKFQLTRHLRKHNRTADTSKANALVFVCDQENCQEVFFNKEEFTQHQSQAHCNGSISSNSNSNSNSNTNSNTNSVNPTRPVLQMACSVCHQVFTRRRALRLHLKTHEEALEARKIFMCLQCDKSYTSKSNLKTHIKAVHEFFLQQLDDISSQVQVQAIQEVQDVLLYRCLEPNCNGVFAYKHVLERHLEKIHQHHPTKEKKKREEKNKKPKKRKSKWWYEEETKETFQNLKKRLLY